jgi:hypothetical protein
VKEAQAIHTPLGVRVLDTRFHESGTIVDKKILRNVSEGNAPRFTLGVLYVKLDVRTWLQPIRYYLNNKPGRKIRDLEFM